MHYAFKKATGQSSDYLSQVVRPSNRDVLVNGEKAASLISHSYSFLQNERRTEIMTYPHHVTTCHAVGSTMQRLQKPTTMPRLCGMPRQQHLGTICGDSTLLCPHVASAESGANQDGNQGEHWQCV
ncbi:unnamed protein product [Ceratitis capitata]|uniref:(Mediterranean fruit fly) hypothetical protein n=1 Tax=Ceratitis capitata TaxID=7213 RepID=A0A811VCI9_CERCA|nr:unnamed protein product [Ceratitis capitata]